MKLCVKYRLNPTKEQEEYLNKLGFYGTKLYNTDNHIRREQWDKTGKIPNWYVQKKELKKNHWYRLLPSQTAQAIIKNLQDNYCSWFGLRKTDSTANPPMFRKKERLSPLTFYQQFTIKGNKLTLGMSRKFKEENSVSKMTFEFNDWKHIEGQPKMCTILFVDGKWMAHIVYEIPDVNPKDNPNIMACDIGIVNLMGTVDTKGNTKLYTGKQALAIQHYFNKEIARVQSATKIQHKKKWSKALSRMTERKNRQINQILHTVSKEVVKDAEKNKVGTIVVGDIKNIRKQEDGSGKNIGKVNNHKLHSWGFAKLQTQIRYKANVSGIRVVEVSERDTSKTCSVCGLVKKSNRKYRGFYRCKCGNRMNADVNGAVNILKRYLQENKISRSIGSVAEPLIWRCNNVVPA